MRIAAKETAPHIALRNCSKQWEKVHMYYFGEGVVWCNQALVLQKVFY